MFSQILWGSIGYASGAAVGAFTAAKEQTGRFKRHILITGDGSAQMTIQAVGDLVRLGLDPIMLVRALTPNPLTWNSNGESESS